METNVTITNLTPGILYAITVTSVAGDNFTEGGSFPVSQYTSKFKVKTSL